MALWVAKDLHLAWYNQRIYSPPQCYLWSSTQMFGYPQTRTEITGSSILGPTFGRSSHIITEATGIEPASPFGQTVFKTVRCANQLASNITESEGADPSCPCGTLTFQISVFAVPPTLYDRRYLSRTSLWKFGVSQSTDNLISHITKNPSYSRKGDVSKSSCQKMLGHSPSFLKAIK